MQAPKTPVTSSKDLDDEDAVVDADLILQHKENIQPLASGRRATALAGSLSVTPKQKDNRLITERAQLEEEVELAVDNDDDPLATWIRYVDWTVDNYPQGVSAESGLLELLERATRLFASDPRYKNDMRYLKLWIHYASYVDHPIKIFSYLNTNEIGTAYALFYEEYCNALERSGRRDEAIEMYDIGIARKAHPLARLQARKRDFSVRMMSSSLPPVESSQLSSSQSGRSALAERKPKVPIPRENAENRNPTLSSSRGSSQSRSVGNNRGAFQIYTEGDGESSSGNAWTDLETRDAHRKENYRGAVAAQGEVLKQSTSEAPRTPRVEVYVDEEEEDNAPKTPARPSRDDGVFTLSSKKPGIDTLKRDPLRNHAMPPPPPPEPQSSVEKSIVKEPGHQSSGKLVAPALQSSTRSKPSKSLPSVKPNERLQIDVSLLVLPDGTEIHPLERRARDFGVADKKWPKPGPELAPNPYNGLQAGDIETRVDFEGTKPMTLSNTNFTNMTRDATVTINTKEALMAVYGMYNSPTKSLTSGKVLAAMMDPRTADMPTPMSVTANAARDENAGTAKKPGFKPFVETATPGPSKISNENQRTPGLIFQTPGTSRGLSTGKKTLSLKQALQPVQSFPEEDEEEDDDEGYGPVTPAPIRHAKPLGAIIPFVDEPPKASPSTSKPKKAGLAGIQSNEVGPRQEEDLFFVDPRPKVKFQPPPQSPEPEPSLPPGVVDDESEDVWDNGEEEDNEQDEEGIEETDGYVDEEEFEQEEDVEYAARWAPALTPITERTYEHTGNSKMWSTPLSMRDKSVMDTPFEASRAFQEAERLAAELRAEEDESIRHDEPGVLQSWEEAEQSEEPEPTVIDPYIKKSIAQLVERLAMPSNHRDLRPQTCGQLEKLQKFVNPKGRKSTPVTPRRGEENSYSLVLDGHEYDVHRKLGEGGFGAVFLADDISLLDSTQDDSGSDSALVAIKVVKPAIVWESVVLDRIHRIVHESIRPSLIIPRRLYIFQDESYHILNYSNHGTLLEAVNKAGDLKVGSGMGGVSSTIPGMDEMLAMFFTVELLKILEGLHSAGFIHGDLKIDNCMVRLDECRSWASQYDPSGANGWSSKGVVLIDFGRAIDTSLYPRGTSFTTDWKMDKRDCLEMREGRPWTYETDYYGLAGIVFCMLFGKYMELPVVKDGIQKLPATLKRYWKTVLWERLFSALLNPNGFGRPLPIVDELRAIRLEMETWLVENGNRSTRPATLRALVKRLEALSV